MGIIGTAINNAAAQANPPMSGAPAVVTSPGVTATGAVDPSQTPTTANQAAQADPTNPVTAATTTASTYDPTMLNNPTAWNVSQDQTVQGQLNNILSNNSPIIQQARSGAIQTANSRGLANSSLAATAGESAAINSAIPIATSDATTMAKAAGYNADEQNQFAVNNANIQNTAAGFNAQQTQAANTASANATNATNQFNASQELQNNQFNVSQANATQLANIESNYKQLMQTSASASDLYKQTVDSIKQIQLSTDLDATAKQSAVDQQLKLLQTGMAITGAISNLDLGNLVTFNNTANSPTLNDTSSLPWSLPNFNFGY